MTDIRRWFFVTAALTLSTSLADAQVPYLISTYAGGLPGPTAATATNYAFRNANSLVIDRYGNAYMSTGLHCVFRLDLNGTIWRVAGTGQAGFSGDGGSAVNAQLNNPQGLAVDFAGNLYIADQNNQRIRKVTPAGIITTVAGPGAASFLGDNGQATSAYLQSPQGVAVDAVGNLYIADPPNYRIRQVAPDGTITTFAGTGTAGNSGDGGPATAATLSYPAALALGPTGNLYIADPIAHEVRKIAPTGIVTLVAGTGSNGYSGDSGPATAAQLNGPAGLTVDAEGNLFIADRNNFRVREVNPAGTISTYAGSTTFGTSGDGGPATRAELAGPASVAIDPSHNLFIADKGLIRLVNASGIISTLAGQGNVLFSGDGLPAPLAQFSGPWGLARDGAGNLYVVDSGNYRVRQITPAGIISTFAGTGTAGDSGDGSPATSANITTSVVAADPQGNIFLADAGLVRKVATDLTISTVGGTGVLGRYLPGLAADVNNVYISDWNNQRIRKVTKATGTITTIVGTGTAGFTPDGSQGSATQVSDPAGLVLDSTGNLYYADYGNNRVRKLALDGTISTVAGNGASANTGDGGPAISAGLYGPFGLAMDGLGNLYVAVQGNAVRKVSTNGNISTIAGTGVAGYYGDGGPATAAQLWNPYGLAVDGGGNIFVSDFANNAVRVLQPLGTEPVLSVSSTHTGVFPVGGSGTYTLTVTNASQALSTTGSVTVTDTLPSHLTFVSALGTGWQCTWPVCTNSNTLPSGQSYPSIDVVVNVLAAAAPQVTNVVMVSGGGTLGTASQDVTFVGSSSPVLEIASTHAGDFVAGKQGTYTITVANQPSAASTGSPVTVTEMLPSGLTLQSMTSTDSAWICSGNTCTESNPLAGGAAFSPITVVVSVASNAASSLTNVVTVSGGGSVPATANDQTNISSLACSITGDSVYSVADVQAIVNEALGVNAAADDLNHDHVVNVTDVQIVINAVLSLGCTL